MVPEGRLPTEQETAGARSVKLTWHGHATFVLVSPSGLRILTDPRAPKTGYDRLSPGPVDLVTVSHDHYDHNWLEGLSAPYRVLDGVREERVVPIAEEVADVSIRTVASWHDDSGGSERGPNAIFVFEIEGIRIAHLGDLGHVLTARQVKRVGSVDVLLTSVGGRATIDAPGATRVAEQLEAKVVVPMHYWTPDLRSDLRFDTVESFLEGKTVVCVESDAVTIDRRLLKEGPLVLVLNYRLTHARQG